MDKETVAIIVVLIVVLFAATCCILGGMEIMERNIEDRINYAIEHNCLFKYKDNYYIVKPVNEEDVWIRGEDNHPLTEEQIFKGKKKIIEEQPNE